jgi:hypothetical protein
MKDCRRYAAGVLWLLSLAAIPAPGAPITLEAVDSGAYFANGLHNPGIENYLTGVFGQEHRSFFVFDFSSVVGTIEAATLRLFNPEVSEFLHGYVSPDPTETLNIHHVSTPAADIVVNTGGITSFNDLGSGTLYGSKIVSAADNGTVVEIILNGAAIADLNTATGLFVLGGALGTIGAGDQFVFGFSMAAFVADHTRQLVLDVRSVPEPSSLSLIIALALLGAASAARRRHPAPHRPTSAAFVTETCRRT